MLKTAFIILLTLPQAAAAHPSVSILMDSRGNVYYSDLEKVWKISTAGSKSVVVGDVHTHELYIDKEDNLYGEHLWYNGDATKTWGHYVWKYSPSGKLEKIKPDTAGALSDYGFHHDSEGNMYWPVRDKPCQHVVRKSPDGSLTKIGTPCLNNIRWMITSPNRDVYVVDFHDLKKIDHAGRTTILATGIPEKKVSQAPIAEQHYLGGLWIDENQSVYVADYIDRAVKKVDKKGKVTTVVRTSIPWSPAGTLVAPNGDFWILEYSMTNAVRVEKISANGNRTIY
jgi:hypothetical protein